VDSLYFPTVPAKIDTMPLRLLYGDDQLVYYRKVLALDPEKDYKYLWEMQEAFVMRKLASNKDFISDVLDKNQVKHYPLTVTSRLELFAALFQHRKILPAPRVLTITVNLMNLLSVYIADQEQNMHLFTLPLTFLNSKSKVTDVFFNLAFQNFYVFTSEKEAF